MLLENDSNSKPKRNSVLLILLTALVFSTCSVVTPASGLNWMHTSLALYVCICKFIEALQLGNQLSIHFTTSNEELWGSAQKFQNESTLGIIDGCAAWLDGMLLPIQVPSSDKTGNVMAYYSGQYADHGINIQAACDSHRTIPIAIM